jgi:hypothetical protein
VGERTDKTAARGPMARNFPGVIRPKLDWKTGLSNVDGGQCEQAVALDC